MIVEFRCKKCNNVYEMVVGTSDVPIDATGKYSKINCPQCFSKKKEKLISLPARAVFVNPVGTDLWEASHDYRAKHEIEKPGGARDQRKMAEEFSHMGPNPYNEIDDISDGNHFGEIK